MLSKSVERSIQNQAPKWKNTEKMLTFFFFFSKNTKREVITTEPLAKQLKSRGVKFTKGTGENDGKWIQLLRNQAQTQITGSK